MGERVGMGMGVVGLEKEEMGVVGLEKEEKGVVVLEKEEMGVVGLEKEEKGVVVLEKEEKGVVVLVIEEGLICSQPPGDFSTTHWPSHSSGFHPRTWPPDL